MIKGLEQFSYEDRLKKCSVWRSEGSGKTSEQPSNKGDQQESWQGTFFQGQVLIPQRGFKLKEDWLDYIGLDIGKIFFTVGVIDTRPGCPDRLWMPHHWTYSKPDSTWL